MSDFKKQYQMAIKLYVRLFMCSPPQPISNTHLQTAITQDFDITCGCKTRQVQVLARYTMTASPPPCPEEKKGVVPGRSFALLGQQKDRPYIIAKTNFPPPPCAQEPCFFFTTTSILPVEKQFQSTVTRDLFNYSSSFSPPPVFFSPAVMSRRNTGMATSSNGSFDKDSASAVAPCELA